MVLSEEPKLAIWAHPWATMPLQGQVNVGSMVAVMVVMATGTPDHILDLVLAVKETHKDLDHDIDLTKNSKVIVGMLLDKCISNS